MCVHPCVRLCVCACVCVCVCLCLCVYRTLEPGGRMVSEILDAIISSPGLNVQRSFMRELRLSESRRQMLPGLGVRV
jgi:hypothetical protein